MNPWIGLLAVIALPVLIIGVVLLIAAMHPERINDGQESNEEDFKFPQGHTECLVIPEADAADGYYRHPTEDASPTGTVHN